MICCSCGTLSTYDENCGASNLRSTSSVPSKRGSWISAVTCTPHGTAANRAKPMHFVKNSYKG
jgi:hypothetical protein